MGWLALYMARPLSFAGLHSNGFGWLLVARDLLLKRSRDQALTRGAGFHTDVLQNIVGTVALEDKWALLGWLLQLCGMCKQHQ